MPIVRVQKNKKHPYLIMNKTGLDDKRLSIKSKGLLAFLLSKPDNWYITVKNLANSSSDSAYLISLAIKELVKFGYISKHRVRSSSGRYSFYDYIVYEKPVKLNSANSNSQPKCDIPEQVKPIQVGPVQVKPIQVKPIQVKPIQVDSSLLINKNKINNKTSTSAIPLIKNTFNVDASFFKLDSKTQKLPTIKLLEEINVKNHNKILSLFSIIDILKYGLWIKSHTFKIDNPTGFLVSAIRDKWDG